VFLEVPKSNKYTRIITGSALVSLAFPVSFLPGLLLSLPLPLLWADALALAASLGLLGFFTEKMKRYGIPESARYVLFFTGISGIPLFAVFLFFDTGVFNLFLPGYPVRLLFNALLCLVFLYRERWQEEEPYTPADWSQTGQPRATPKQPSENVPGAPYPEHILVRSGNGMKIIPLTDLICIEAEGDYIKLITADGFWLKEETMKNMQETLPPSQYVRVHRSFIVNLGKISRIERCGKQQYLHLTNGVSVRISASGYMALKNVLGF
jgi:hypothetical protein